MARGSGCTIEDVDGNVFLDFTAGIAVTSTGHSHPAVVEAIADQASRFIHMSGTDFYYGPEIELAERLAKLTPGGSAKRVFFTNSGTETIEAALKLARFHSRRQRVISFLRRLSWPDVRRDVAGRIEGGSLPRVRAAALGRASGALRLPA